MKLEQLFTFKGKTDIGNYRSKYYYTSKGLEEAKIAVKHFYGKDIDEYVNRIYGKFYTLEGCSLTLSFDDHDNKEDYLIIKLFIRHKNSGKLWEEPLTDVKLNNKLAEELLSFAK